MSRPFRRQQIKRILGCGAAALTLATGAGATMFIGAGTAVAPEPARLTNTLYTTSTTAAYYYSNVQTTGYFLSVTNWTVSSLPIGAPCSPTPFLPPGSVLTRVVVGTGNFRKCQ